MSFIKVVVIGSASTGKTSLLNMYVNKRFSTNTASSIGTDLYQKSTVVDGDIPIKLSLFDTAGQERYRSLCSAFYRGASICICIFDITSAESFDVLDEWVDDFRSSCGLDPHERFPIHIVGNKSDLDSERAVPREQAEAYCRARNFKYYETSAKLGDGVDFMFKEAAQAAYSRSKLRDSVEDPTGATGGVQRARLAPVRTAAQQQQQLQADEKKLCSSCNKN